MNYGVRKSTDSILWISDAETSRLAQLFLFTGLRRAASKEAYQYLTS